ncbi:TonB-dependent receptor [Halosquirtibacter xylanolyticus]|uniref:SusC/RagA family TonB-linked outer membrane protein n=1 Tax=Halosquirtibacter xylanolyticus TaxID=3374599 RepID=UPI003749AF99|nr:TonB-dependent receptor [Prolixibacteraceae bacterium]
MRKQLLTKKIATLLLLSVYMMISSSSIAQEKIVITGTVSDASGETIPGASVRVKESDAGTITNFDGVYQLKATEGNTLVFSYVGYASKEVIIKGKTKIDVILSSDIKGLDEVVIVGYGTQKKANLTGAVETISSETIVDRPAPSLSHALQGSVAGLNVTVENGQPGSAPKINIRGTTSITSGSPLVLVDGVEMAMNLVNPDDVENITVLKDAASCAIYGGRAAFGVVLVTTKNGKRDREPTVNVSAYYGFNRPSRQPDPVNTYDYMLNYDEWRVADGEKPFYGEKVLSAYQKYVNGEDISYLQDENGDVLDDNGNVINFKNTDWNDLIFANQSPVQKYSANVSGGSGKVSYYGSFGMYDQQGLLKAADDSYKRINVSLKIDVDLYKWWTIGLKSTLNRSKSDKPVKYNNIGSYWHAIYRQKPNASSEYDDEMGAWKSKSNPIAYLTDGGRENIRIDDNWITANTIIRPFKGMIIKADYTTNRKSNDKQVDFRKIAYLNQGEVLSEPANDYVKQSAAYKDYETINAFAEYTGSAFDAHNFKLMAGYNQEEIIDNSYWVQRKDKLAETPNLGLTSGDQTTNGSGGVRSIRGGFFRVNYNFKERYLMEVNGRYDLTSRFRTEDRGAFYPSYSAGWRVTEEPFMKGVKKVIDNFKLRVSYASQGNQMIKDKVNGKAVFSYQPYLGTMQTKTIPYILGGERAMVITPASATSADLTWETVTTTNYGLDLTALRGRMNVSFDKYERETKDMLLPMSGPAMFGAAYPKVNGADLVTKGWELSLKWQDKIGSDFGYGVTLALSDNETEITRFDNPNNIIDTKNIYYKGQKLGEIWGYETEGIFQSVEEVKEQNVDYSQFRLYDSQPGDVRYKDLNGDGKITNGAKTLDDHGDLKIIGNDTPRYAYGITTNLNFKGFDCTIFFQGVAKRDYWIGSTHYWGNIAQTYTVPTKWTHNNHWREDNKDGFLPRNAPNKDRGNMNKQTRYLQDASYIRLKNITFGYTFPKHWTQGAGISKIRLYVTGQNLWEYTKLNETFDPEGLNEGGKIYPFQRTVAFGANITF